MSWKTQLSTHTYLKGRRVASWKAAALPWGEWRAPGACPGVLQGSVSTGTGLSLTPPVSPAIDHNKSGDGHAPFSSALRLEQLNQEQFART